MDRTDEGKATKVDGFSESKTYTVLSWMIHPVRDIFYGGIPVLSLFRVAMFGILTIGKVKYNCWRGIL